MGEKKKKIPEWIVRAIFLAVGALLGALIPWLLNIPTRSLDKQFKEANSDNQRAGLIFEIVEKSDSKYLSKLDSLILTIEDEGIREAMILYIEARKELSEPTEKEIQPRKQNESMDIVLEKQEELFDSTCAIFYLKGDSIAEEDAKVVKDFLLTKKQSRLRNNPFRYYPIRTKDTSWFDDNYPLAKSVSDTNKNIFIFYNLPDPSRYAMKPYYYIKEGIFGIVYKEERNGSVNHAFRRDSLLHGNFYEDVSHIPLSKPEEKLEEWKFAIVIPPYFLTEAILDSLYWLEE